MNIKILLLLALVIILILNYKRILAFSNYIKEQRAIEFKKRTNLDLRTLSRISAFPPIIFFGLEHFFLNRSVLYFDENYLYKITRKDPVIQHLLSDITKVKRTNIMINERRVWKIIIKDSGSEISYKVRSNYDKFDLFLEKIKENPNAIVDSKYILGFFE